MRSFPIDEDQRLAVASWTERLLWMVWHLPWTALVVFGCTPWARKFDTGSCSGQVAVLALSVPAFFGSLAVALVLGRRWARTGSSTARFFARRAARWRARLAVRFGGAAIVDPDSVWIGPGARLASGAMLGQRVRIARQAELSGNAHLGPDVVIGPGACLRGFCEIGARTEVGAGALLEDVRIGTDVRIEDWAVVRGGSIPDGAVVRADRAAGSAGGLPDPGLDKPGQIR